MRTIITEEMRYRERLDQYALKHGVTKAARRYHTYRQFVYRQLKKYDGTIQSLALKSRRPHGHPKAHTEEELSLIKKMLRRNGTYGLAEVYVRCRALGYTRSFGSMCRQIRTRGLKKEAQRQRSSYIRYSKLDGRFPGDKVQIDIKYVPISCLRFPLYGDRYYQITAIDEYSRKRVLRIVREKSCYETSLFLEDLEKAFGFKIHQIQVDNGREFVSDQDTDKVNGFEKICIAKGYKLHRIRPYSPWQNGKVERSHREDEKILYSRRVFWSKKELIDAVKRHERRYNKTAKQVLGFRSPNQVVLDYFSM